MKEIKRVPVFLKHKKLSYESYDLIFSNGVIFNQGSAEPQYSASICQGFRGSSVKKIKKIT